MARKIFSLLISFSLLFQQIGFASVAAELNIAGRLSRISNGFAADRFRPVHIRFFSFDAQNDSIKVMLDKGDIKDLKGNELDSSTRELLNYFLVGVNLPNDKFWVNLRPDSANEIIDDYLAKTDVGRIMLETDLQLKKDTALFTSPQTPEGREYWDKLYKKAEELYGYQEVTIPTLTRPWIVPNEVIVRESADSAYIYKATLKVMLEQDFLKDSAMYSFKDARAKALNEYSSQLIRELIIPKLTQEVNLSKRYSGLRQVYYSIILSRWFKSRFAGQAGKYGSRIDSKDLTGLTSAAAWSKSTYFEAYKQSFAKGEYNIKETVRTPTGQVIRSYFSGGQDFSSSALTLNGPSIKEAAVIPMKNALSAAGLVPGEAGSPIRDINTDSTLSGDKAENIEQQTQGMPGLEEKSSRPALQRGWVIANHIFMSIHSAFLFPYYIDRTISEWIVPHGWLSSDFPHATPEHFLTEIFSGAIFAGLTGHVAIWWHERGHYWQAVKALTLPKAQLEEAQRHRSGIARLWWELKLFALAPSGHFPGINKTKLTYYISGPDNLSVSAAGPRASGRLALAVIPAAAILIGAGLLFNYIPAVYAGRLFLGIAAVAFLDRWLADEGKYKQFRDRERAAKQEREQVQAVREASWLEQMPKVKQLMRENRLQEIKLPDGRSVRAPWGFRNCAMGGKHTEKQYPDSNISMQEGMFVPLSAKSQEEAQEMTVALQHRLKEILDSTEGCRVMGIGLEGGLAPYITPMTGEVPELRLWRMMKQAIEDLGYVPGRDVAIALDPALSELENAYRDASHEEDAVGKYLFWRSKEQVTMNRDEILALYLKAIEEGIPIISIEDGFSENDWDGWSLLRKKLGDRLWVIGDDLVTTNDFWVEKAADSEAIDTLLTKANQIGSLSETALAMLVAMGRGLELVISHRSQSPNDDFEADLALASEAMGLKAGGGANTERLVKYGRIAKIIREAIQQAQSTGGAPDININSDNETELISVVNNLVVTGITAYEESTNSGMPTVGVKITVGLPGSKTYGRLLTFYGATPLGTSAGSREAIHLVDSVIEPSPVVERHPELFDFKKGDQTYRFKKTTTKDNIEALKDPELTELWRKAQRYLDKGVGKGVMNAVENVRNIIAPQVLGKSAAELGDLISIDRALLKLEVDTARNRGKDTSDPVFIAQRKGNLGMNAILSVGLALARFRAVSEGKELYEIFREQLLLQPMAKIIAEAEGRPDQWEEILISGSYEGLKAGLRKAAAKAKADGQPFYQVVRSHLPVYDFAFLQASTNEANNIDALTLSQASVSESASSAVVSNLAESITKEIDRALEASPGISTRELTDNVSGIVNQLEGLSGMESLKEKLSGAIVRAKLNGQGPVVAKKELVDAITEIREVLGEVSAAAGSSPANKGGIDFRPNALMINYQPMGNFAGLKPKLPSLSKAQLEKFDVRAEFAALENMVDKGFLPSGERIKELLAAASSPLKGGMEGNRERILALLVKIGILEETQCCLQEASNAFKESLVLADSLA